MGKLTLLFDVEGWLQADRALCPKQWTLDPPNYKHVPLGAFSKDSVQETLNVRKSDPVIFKFSYSEALNVSELASKIVSSLGKHALEFVFPLTLKWGEIINCWNKNMF